MFRLMVSEHAIDRMLAKARADSRSLVIRTQEVEGGGTASPLTGSACKREAPCEREPPQPGPTRTTDPRVLLNWAADRPALLVRRGPGPFRNAATRKPPSLGLAPLSAASSERLVITVAVSTGHYERCRPRAVRRSSSPRRFGGSDPSWER